MVLLKIPSRARDPYLIKVFFPVTGNHHKPIVAIAIPRSARDFRKKPKTIKQTTNKAE